MSDKKMFWADVERIVKAIPPNPEEIERKLIEEESRKLASKYTMSIALAHAIHSFIVERRRYPHADRVSLFRFKSDHSRAGKVGRRAAELVLMWAKDLGLNAELSFGGGGIGEDVEGAVTVPFTSIPIPIPS